MKGRKMDESYGAGLSFSPNSPPFATCSPPPPPHLVFSKGFLFLAHADGISIQKAGG
jgi:hypothetical protein